MGIVREWGWARINVNRMSLEGYSSKNPVGPKSQRTGFREPRDCWVGAIMTDRTGFRFRLMSMLESPRVSGRAPVEAPIWVSAL